jgi:hypothetical protein
MKRVTRISLAALALPAFLWPAQARGDVPIPAIPASHPRVLLVGEELARFQADLATQRPAMKRFKEQVVDAQLAGANIYGYEAWYSAFMGVVTGQPQYCAHAVQMTDAFLDAEALKIHEGDVPDARADSYLFIGEVVGGVALVYDWCHANLTPTQKLRWGNYADRFVDNVWNQATHHWGEPTAANNYSWDGPAKPPGSGWSVDNPVNNYYYSFLRATMLWGLVSKHEPARPMADGFLQRFRNQKIQNQLVPVFDAQVPGGGSREGTGYGTAMGALFALYHLWEKTTGERIANLTPHTEATMPYVLHSISPRRDFLAPIGDHARDSTAEFYDYHRAELLALSTLFRGTPMARTVRDFLAASTRPRMGDRFNWVNDVLYDGVEGAAPAALNTAYLAQGTGHFFARSSWNTGATWLTFLAGAYTESHAHPDGLSLLLWRNGWLVYDTNFHSHSGIQNTQEAHALVTQRRASDNVLLPMYSYEADTSPVRPESSAHLRALAQKAAYTYVAADSGTLFVHPSQGDKGVRASREIVFIKPGTVIVFDRAEYTLGASIKKFQLPTPGLPSIAGRVATYHNGTSRLDVHALSPPSSTLSITDMRTVDPDFQAGYRIDSTVSTTGLSSFLNVLSVDGAVASAARGANDGEATILLGDGRTVTVAFDLAGAGGTIEVRNSAGHVVVSEPLPATITQPALLGAPPCQPGDADGDGMPDCVEEDEGSDAAVRDNDVFASARWFAMQQYRDFLAREGDAGGIAFWAERIATGASSRGQVIESFFDSPEFQGAIAPVARLYFAYFLRIPDYAGLDFWIGYYRAGNSLDAISDFFAGSAEFQSRYGSLDNAGFVNLVYQNVLGRAPDPGGFAFWKGQLDSGQRTRGQVMLGFSESEEFRALIGPEVYVTMAYMGMLRRAPEPGGFSFWVQYIDAGNSGLELIDGFLASPEYRGRFLP